MTELEKKLAALLRQAMTDIEALHRMLHCHDTETMRSEECMICPVKTDCECDGVPHWVHTAEAAELIGQPEL